LPAVLHAQLPAPAPAQAVPAADNCEPIRQQIEARFRAGGVQPVLVVTEAGATVAGRVVGTCGSGRRQIVRLGQAPLATAAASAPAERRVDSGPVRSGDQAAERAPERQPADKIPTECKDGSIVIGPNCDDPRAVRMTSAELAASLAPAKPASADAPASAPADAPADMPARPASR
jgi:hypothetical protein